MENRRFYSHGKLLITGEYLVLDGAQALALPTKYGQDMQVSLCEAPEIIWRSMEVDGTVWMEERFSVNRIVDGGIENSDSDYLKTLLRILGAAATANPHFFKSSQGYCIETRLEFPRLWGLGTSSTLINNIAQWVGVDAFQLLEDSFGGSGYDIACAQHDTAVLYTKTASDPLVEAVELKPVFSQYLYFVYLNQKQSSKDGIARYRNFSGDITSKRDEINAITKRLLQVTELDELELLLEQHETIIASVIGMPKIKDLKFPDFPGAIKSLGAWGGDFVLVTAKKNPQAYFKAKGFETVLSYDSMIL